MVSLILCAKFLMPKEILKNENEFTHIVCLLEFPAWTAAWMLHAVFTYADVVASLLFVMWWLIRAHFIIVDVNVCLVECIVSLSCSDHLDGDLMTVINLSEQQWIQSQCSILHNNVQNHFNFIYVFNKYKMKCVVVVLFFFCINVYWC